MKSASQKLMDRLGVAPAAPASRADVIQHPAADKPQFNIPPDILADVEATAGAQSAANAQNSIGKMIEGFNAEYFVSIEGGTTFVFHEAYDHELGRPTLLPISTHSFRSLYSNRHVDVAETRSGGTATKRVCAADVWMNHPARRTFPKGLVLLPGGKAPEGTYNLWRGFGYTPKEGATLEDAKPGLIHLKQVVCSGNIAHFRYLLGWLAHAVQRPDRQAEVAIVLQGGRGTGKGTMGRWFRDLFGSHGMHIQHPRHLVGNFNAHLRTCIAMFVDESFFVGDRAGNAVLKSLITEDQLTIERKGVDAFSARNRLKIVMATNEDHAILAGTDERRYFVLRVSDEKAQDKTYFAKLDHWWRNGGKAALLGYLLGYDLSGFDIRTPPNTAALEAQKLLSLTPLDAWLFERLTDGRISTTDSDWKTTYPRDTIANAFTDYAKQHGNRYARTSTDAVGQGLRKHLKLGDQRETTGMRRRLWVFPSLVEARNQFAASVGIEFTPWAIGEDGDDDGL
jgi:hypothetical protein